MLKSSKIIYILDNFPGVIDGAKHHEESLPPGLAFILK